METKEALSVDSGYPLVSVVIPSFNCGRYIAETVESVLRQTYGNVEIIVVDDGSTDGTGEILLGFRNRIQYIYQQNQGSSKARNVGIRIAKGEYIAFLDADDRWHPEKIEIQVDLFRKLPGIDMVFTDYSTIDGEGNRVERFAMRNGFPVFKEYNLRIEDIFPESRTVDLPLGCGETRERFDGKIYFGNVFDKLFMGNFILPSTEMVRRSTIYPSILFREDYKRAVDQDFHLRFSRNHAIAFLPVSTTDYRINIGDKLSGNKNIPELIANTIETRRSILRSEKIFHENNRDFVRKVFSKDYARLSYYHLSELSKKDARTFALESIKQKNFQIKGYFLLLFAMAPRILLTILKGVKKHF